MLAEVALNVEILDALKPVLKPPFAPFQQGQYCTNQSRIHQLMVKIHVKTVNIGGGHRKHQDIMRSWMLH